MHTSGPINPPLPAVHYGDDLATPINIDTMSQSKVAITSYLWSFVSAEW